MKRNVVLEALVRLAASLAALFVLTAMPAMAAERALINFIGYDQQSNYFAYEEFGMSDGAGGYYSHIYVIDLAKDSWVKGAPFSFEDPSETGDMSLTDVRGKARALAAPTLKSLGIDIPPQILALNGDGEPDNRTVLSWMRPNCCGVDSMEETKFKLTLTPTLVKPEDSGDCADYTEAGVYGFSLAISQDTDSLDIHTGDVQIHKDGPTIPKSRGCVTGYSIYAVLQAFEGGAGVAVLEVWPFGFEGPDRRFLVVPINDLRL